MLFSRDVVSCRRTALRVTGAEMEDCLLGAPASSGNFLTTDVAGFYCVVVVVTHPPSLHRVTFWPPVFALSRRRISGEQNSSFELPCRSVQTEFLFFFSFFFNSFPFFGARLKINSRTGTTQGAIRQH